MYLEKISLSNFRCFSEAPMTVKLEQDLTCLVGNNGSGKTTLAMALKRLFGSTREERTITREDFYLAPKEDPKEINGREMYIEVTFSFPELIKDTEKARETCPAFSSVIYADKKDGELKARMRLEALWDEAEYEDEVSSKIYWITTPNDVEFGEGKDFKLTVPSHDRKYIKLRYVPAFRDSKVTLRNEVKTLTKILEDYTSVSNSDQKEIELLAKT